MVAYYSKIIPISSLSSQKRCLRAHLGVMQGAWHCMHTRPPHKYTGEELSTLFVTPFASVSTGKAYFHTHVDNFCHLFSLKINDSNYTASISLFLFMQHSRCECWEQLSMKIFVVMIILSFPWPKMLGKVRISLVYPCLCSLI